ncbi:hypothetical protein D3C71_2096090 [compost metagenome]
MLQQAAIRLFKKSLSNGGFLALGSKEALSPFHERESREWEHYVGPQRIYRYYDQQEE